MIYVVTVHHATDKWIPLQARSLARWLPEARVFAVSDYPAPGHFYRRWPTAEVDRAYRGGRVDANHAWRLRHLIGEVLREAAPDDVVLTLDSDALLIADPHPTLERLGEYALIAVSRDRESSEAWKRYQPHPCFSAVRVETWVARRGTWDVGEWVQYDGTRRHVGSACGGQLLPTFGDSWLKLRRQNVHNPHFLLFALYGEDGAPLVYHHGAGSRVPIFARERNELSRLRWEEKARANQTLSDAWFARAQADEEFWRALMAEPACV